MSALAPVSTCLPDRPTLVAALRRDPFADAAPEMLMVSAGDTLAALVARADLDPMELALAVAYVDGELVERDDWGAIVLEHGRHIRLAIVPQGGDGGGGKILTSILSIAVLALAFFVSGGALVGLGSAFGAGEFGATFAGAIVGAVGQLAISALVKPPAPEQDAGLEPVNIVQGASNRFAPFEPIQLGLGRRRFFPRQIATGFQEVVGDDFYYRMVLEWGPIGVSIEDLRVGDTPLTEIDGWQAQHRLVESDPHPTLYPAAVFQETVGANLQSTSDFETRRTIPDATQAGILFAFPQGLGETSRRGRARSASASVLVEFREVINPGSSESFGPWRRPGQPGFFQTPDAEFRDFQFETRPRFGGSSGAAGSAGAYTFTNQRRSQPFYRYVSFNFPAAGVYEVRTRRTSPAQGVSDTSISDELVFALFESRRPGRPTTREDVAYSVFRFKGTDETQGRIQTLNAINSRLIPRFGSYLDGVDFAGAGPEHLTEFGLSRNGWELILWLYRNGLDGRRPVADTAIDWPSFAFAARDARDRGLTFDHIDERGSRIEQLVESIAFAMLGRVAFIGGKLTAVVDGPRLAPVMMFSDRNIRSLQIEKTLSRVPDGFRVTWNDEDDGWRTREDRILVGDATRQTARLFEPIRVPGVTNWDTLHKIISRNFRNSRLQQRNITAEVSAHAVDQSVRLGALIALQTRVIEAGRASGIIREVELSGSGAAIAVVLDQPVESFGGEDMVLIWSRPSDLGVGEVFSTALALDTPAGTAREFRQVFRVPVTGSDLPQAGDKYIFGVVGFERADVLIENIDPVDENWLRLRCVDYAPDRFDETGLAIPDYQPAYAGPPTQTLPALVLISSVATLDQINIQFAIEAGGASGIVEGFRVWRAPVARAEGDPLRGEWEPLPDLPPTSRLLTFDAGSDVNEYDYRVATFDIDRQLGPSLIIDNIVKAVLPAPTGVVAVPQIEAGENGARRAVLLVAAEAVEDVRVEHFVVDVRRVATDPAGDRLPEAEQLPFEQLALIDSDVSITVLRGLAPGGTFDVEVYFRGARQEISPRVRVADVTIADVDVAAAAAGFDVGGAIDQALQDVEAANAATAEALLAAEQTAQEGRAALQSAIDNIEVGGLEETTARIETLEERVETAETTSATRTGIVDTRFDENEAAIVAAEQARTDGDTAQAQALQALQSTFSGELGTVNARVGGLETTLAGSEQATSQRIGLVEAEVAEAEAQLTAVEQAQAGIESALAQRTLEVDAEFDMLEAAFVAEQQARAAGDSAQAQSLEVLRAGLGEQLLPNYDFSELDASGFPVGIEPVEGTNETSFVQVVDGVLHISSEVDANVAYGFPAIPVSDQSTYRVTVRHRTSGAPPTSTSLFLRFNELNRGLPDGRTHIGNPQGGAVSARAVQRTANSSAYENQPFPGSDFEITSFTYRPTPGTQFASFSIYNWTAFRGVYEVDYVEMLEEGTAAAEVAELRQAIFEPDGSLARLTLGVSVPDADAFVQLQAQNENGDALGSVALGADLFAVFNRINGEFIPALSVAGGNAQFTGALAAGGGIFIGTSNARWPVALQPQVYSLTDGESVTYDLDFGVPAQLSFDLGGLPALGEGETYDVRAENSTGTGFTLRAKRRTAGELTLRAGGTDFGQPVDPRFDRVLNAFHPEDAYNGQYLFELTTDVRTFGLIAEPGTVVLEFFVRTAASWVSIGTDGLSANGPTAGLQRVSSSHVMSYSGAQIVDTGGAFAVTVRNGGSGEQVVDIRRVSYATQAGSTESSATVGGFRVGVTVQPRNIA